MSSRIYQDSNKVKEDTISSRVLDFKSAKLAKIIQTFTGYTYYTLVNQCKTILKTVKKQKKFSKKMVLKQTIKNIFLVVLRELLV